VAKKGGGGSVGVQASGDKRGLHVLLKESLRERKHQRKVNPSSKGKEKAGRERRDQNKNCRVRVL